MRVCEYGCGREAVHFFSYTKRWCCKTNTARCPALIAKRAPKISKALKGHIAWNKGIPHTEEARKNMSEAQTGRKHTEETKRKIRAYHHTEEAKESIRQIHLGKPKSEEHRKNLSKAKTGVSLISESSFKKGQIPWNKGKKGLQVAWNKGIPRTEETKDKIRIGHTGKTLSLEHRQAIGEAHTGQKRTPETRVKMKLAATGEKSSQWKGGIAKEPYSQG